LLDSQCYGFSSICDRQLEIQVKGKSKSKAAGEGARPPHSRSGTFTCVP